MTDNVGIIASSTGISSGAVARAPVSSSVAASSHSSSQTTFMNPRVIEDPTAGFITQYLSANDGQIVSQVPSAITVAYLRLGLEPDGTTKPTHVPGSVTATA